jgi:hypothetical protein
MTTQPKPQHGGRREGSGRKALPGSLTACFVLTKTHLAAIRQWATAHGCRSVSEAIRQMIDAARPH